MPEIWYELEGKHRYYPDIWIPSENLIIEVKSTWTYKNKLQNNLAKKNAVIKKGMNFQFWICSDKHIIEIL